MRYRAYREYRDRDPDLAIIGAEDEFPAFSRALEAEMSATFRSKLRPGSPLLQATGTAWTMSSPDDQVVVFSMDGRSVRLDRPLAEGRTARWIGQGAGSVTTTLPVASVELNAPSGLADAPWAVILERDSPNR